MTSENGSLHRVFVPVKLEGPASKVRRYDTAWHPRGAVTAGVHRAKRIRFSANQAVRCGPLLSKDSKAVTAHGVTEAQH